MNNHDANFVPAHITLDENGICVGGVHFVRNPHLEGIDYQPYSRCSCKRVPAVLLESAMAFLETRERRVSTIAYTDERHVPLEEWR